MRPATHARFAILSLLLLGLVTTSLGLTPIAASPATMPVAQGTTTHVVQRGDTLYSLARRYGTTVQAILQANGLSNPNFILSLPSTSVKLTVETQPVFIRHCPGHKRYNLRTAEN